MHIQQLNNHDRRQETDQTRKATEEMRKKGTEIWNQRAIKI